MKKHLLFIVLTLAILVGCKKDNDEVVGKIPTVITYSINNIGGYTAVGGGNISDNGGKSITQRGLCWSTSPNPTIGSFLTIESGDIGSFTSNLTNLASNTTYFVRAYATNSVGIAYGNQVSFTTSTLPAISTISVTNISNTTASSGGLISSDGGQQVIQRGVCWSTNPNPTINSDYTVDGSGTGAFSSSLTGLIINATYYVRAYAINSVGVVYGSQEIFSTTAQYISVADVKSLFQNGITTVPPLKKLRGVIISDYTSGNLSNKNLIMQDGSSGILVRFLSAHTFPIGKLVEIDISGAPITLYYGLLQLGGSLSTINLSACTIIGNGTVTPIVTTISNLIANYNLLECTLVKINNCVLSGSITYSGAVNIFDGTSAMTLYTLPSSTFASNPLPTSQVSVTGILTQYSSPAFNPQIWLRNLADVQ